MEEYEEILEILRDILGKEKQFYRNKGQIAFNCPYCDEDRNKGNLEISLIKGVYKCWSCVDTNDTHGPLGKLIEEFGSKKQKKLYNLFRPTEYNTGETEKVKLELPESYTKFKDSNPIYPVYKQAMNYLRSRGITDEIIEKYNIGFSDNGPTAGRIIIPSYDKDGKLNYYIARSWSLRTKKKYKNPAVPKDEIIFNENLINWKKDIYLVEGAFDGFFLPNSIPMLGKHLSNLLLETIYEKAMGNIIICLDGDAFKDAVNLYHSLNGGKLFGRIKIVKLPEDKDVCDLRGEIKDFYIEMQD